MTPEKDALVEKLKAMREESVKFAEFGSGVDQRLLKLIDALLIYEDALDSILGQMELVNDHPIEVVLIAREANAKVDKLFSNLESSADSQTTASPSE
jgi:predicted membrane GTPase involved in stress response